MIFHDPIAQVMIVDTFNKKVWNLTEPESPFVKSVTFQFKGTQGATSSFSVGIDIPYEYAIRWLDDKNSTPFRAMNIVRARIGYASGGWTEWVYGNLQNGGVGLSITGEGLSGTLKMNVIPSKALSYSISKDLLAEAGLDAEKLIRLICKQVGMEAEFTQGASTQLLLWGYAYGKDKSFSQKKNFLGGLDGKDSMSAIEQICLKVGCKHFVYTKDGKRYFSIHTEKDQLNGILHKENNAEFRKYVLRGIVDTSKNQYPLASFSPTSGDESTWTSGVTVAASSVLATGHNTDTGDDVEIEVKPEDQEEPIVGNLNVTSPQELKLSDNYKEIFIDIEKQDGRDGTYMSAPVLPGGEEIFKEQAKNFGRMGNMGLQMEANIPIGIPDEKIGNLCQIWGCGKLYNDVYYIQDLEHSWTPGSWEMKLGLFRRGLKAVSGIQNDNNGNQMKAPK